MRQGRPSGRQLDRLVRMLERCIEADKLSRRKRRESDVFYQKLKILQEMQKETKALIRGLSDAQDNNPKR